MLVLRSVHILSAIFWMGSTLFIGLVLMPGVISMGRQGQQVMMRLTRRIHPAMTTAGLLTVLSGLTMYYFVSGGFQMEVMLGPRLPLTLGALAGLGAIAVGLGVLGRASTRMAVLGEDIAAQGGTPTPQQAAQMASLQATLRRGSALETLLMLLAVLGMVA